ncbi:MAG: TonB-dependent receptor, partial [Pseudohongiellaceae bacterium]
INQAERDIYDPGTTASFAWSDPLCDSGITDASGNPFFTVGLDPRQRAQPGSRSDGCVVDETQWALINYAQERNSIAGSFDHTFDNGTEFYSFLMWSDMETVRDSSGYTGSFGSYSFLPSAGAYIPGMHGQALELGHFAPLFGMEKPLNITNNPADGINGGPNTGFSHSGVYNLLRTGGDDDVTYTETGNAQFGLRGEWDAFDRVLEWDVGYSVGYSSVETERRDFNRMNLHLAGGGLGGPDCVPNGVADFDFLNYNDPNDPRYARNAWNIYESTTIFDYVFEGYYVQPHEPVSLGLTSTNQGQGDCMFFNPFLNSVTDPNVANSPELMDWLTQVTAMKDKRNTQGVLDAVVTGELFEMRGGTAAFALGYQNRQRTAVSRASDLNFPGIQNAIQGYDENGVPNEFGYVSNNMGGSSNSLDYDLDRNVNAIYTELSLPFWDNVESQIALRWEDYGGNVGDEISPKVALSWRPVDTLLLRTSWSQSFRAPNLGIIGAGLDASGVTFLDPLDNQRVRAGLLPPINEHASLESSYTLGGPAPNVGNEYADTYSAGFIWTPGGVLDGASIQADFWRFEVTDRVLPENASSAIRRQIEAFSVAATDPGNYVLNSSMDRSSEILFAPCDPNALEAQFGRDSSERLDCVVDPRTYQVEGVQESIPASERSLIQLKLGAINAGEITADGVDIKLGYGWDNNLGRFGVGLDYTFVNQYTLDNVPGLDNGLLDVGVYDAAGTTGDGNLVRSLPDHKGHLTFNWFNGDHGVTVINRYIGGYDDLTYDLRIDEVNPFVASLMEPEIDDYWRWDAQYNYTHNWGNANLGSTRFTAGLIDVFDADVPVRETGSLDYDAQVHDGRGRRFYLRALWMF